MKRNQKDFDMSSRIRNCPLANFGGKFEKEVLGECRVSWDGKFLPWGKAVWQVRENQPPKKCPFMEKVLAHLNRDGAHFEAYTAVGTALDKYHSIDGYFFFRGVMVTVDASLREKSDCKADILIDDELAEKPAEVANRVLAIFAQKKAECAERIRGAVYH